MSDNINILVPKEAIDSIIQTDAAITKLDIVYRKMLTTIEQGNAILKNNQVTQENLTNSAKETAKVNDQLDAATKKLAASEKALADFDKEKYAATLRNNQALKEQQSEVLKMVQAEKQLTGTIEKAEASTKALTAERKKLDLETIEGTKRLKEINTQIDKNTEIIRTNGDAATKQRMNIGNYKSALEGLPGPLGNIASSANTAGTALKAISKIPLLAAILAIIGALAGLFAAFKSTEEGGDRVQKIMGKLKGILDVLKVAAQSLGLAFADLLSGKFGQAADHLKEGFGGIGGRMRDAAIAGGKLAEALDKIGDEKLAYNIDAVREKIAQLRTEAAETTDPGERAAKLREAIKLTEELYGKQIDWSKRAANAEIENVTAKFKVSAEQLTAFLMADEAGRQEQIKGNQSLGMLANSLNNEGLASLRDKLTEENRLNTEFNRETLRLRKTATAGEEKDQADAAAAFKKRVEDQRKAFEENAKLEAEAIKEMAEEDKRTLIDNQLAISSAVNEQRDKELSALEKRYQAGAMSTEAYEKEKLTITKKYEAEILRLQIDNINKQIEASNLLPGQKAELMAKSAALQLHIDNQLTDDLIANQKKLEDAVQKQMDEEDKAAEKAKELKLARQEGLTEAVAELGNGLFEINDANIEKEIASIERKRDADIKAAGDDKDAQLAINAKYDKQVAEQKTKQAKNDRMAALFNIAINTAVAVMKAMTQDPTGILAAIAAGLGIIQAGIVLAKPLPTYAKGTKGQYNTPSAFVAGEAGTEWVQKQTGEMMAVSQPTVFTNAKGMRVYSNPEIQNLQKMMLNNQVNFDTKELKEIHKGIDNMAKSLAGQRQYIMQNGKTIGYRQNGYARKYLERMIG